MGQGPHAPHQAAPQAASSKPKPKPRKVALIVGLGRHGIGEALAVSFAKSGIKIAITYINKNNEGDARQKVDWIKSKVPGSLEPEVEKFKFDPEHDKAANLINSVRGKLHGLDIVVFASIYSGSESKKKRDIRCRSPSLLQNISGCSGNAPCVSQLF